MHRLIIGTVIIGALAIGTAILIDMDINKTAAPDEKNLTETEIMVENLDVVGSTLRFNYGVEVEGLETTEESKEDITELEEDETEQEGMEITDEDLEGTDYEYPSSVGNGSAFGRSPSSSGNQTVYNQTTNQTTSNQTSTNSGSGSASGGYGGVYYIPPVEEEVTTEATTEEELEAVWVVDVPEQVNTYPVYETEYHSVCNECHAIIDGVANEHLAGPCSSYSTGVPFQVQVDTYTEIIPEQGHWEYR